MSHSSTIHGTGEKSVTESISNIHATTHNSALEEVPQFDHATTKRIVRKIDKRILICCLITYTLNFVDKTLLGYSAIFGIIKSTVCSAACLLTVNWTNSLLASCSRSVQLGVKYILFRISTVGISHHHSHPEASGWQVPLLYRDRMGRCRRCIGSMQQFRRSCRNPLPPRISWSYYSSVFRLHNLTMVYARRGTSCYGILVCWHWRRVYYCCSHHIWSGSFAWDHRGLALDVHCKPNSGSSRRFWL